MFEDELDHVFSYFRLYLFELCCMFHVTQYSKMAFRKMGLVGVDCICLVPDRGQWQTLMDAVIKLWFHKRQGVSLLAE